MIHSTNPFSPADRANALAAAATATPAGRVKSSPTDQIHIDQSATLKAALQQVPEIRPEVVERAKALAADPAYPSAAIIRHISATIVSSPDLSEDNS